MLLGLSLFLCTDTLHNPLMVFHKWNTKIWKPFVYIYKNLISKNIKTKAIIRKMVGCFIKDSSFFLQCHFSVNWFGPVSDPRPTFTIVIWHRTGTRAGKNSVFRLPLSVFPKKFQLYMTRCHLDWLNTKKFNILTQHNTISPLDLERLVSRVMIFWIRFRQQCKNQIPMT